MQINFYMGDNDRKLFHDYIFSRGGYLTPEYWKSINIPIAKLENPIEIDYFTLKIFKQDIFSELNFNDKDWITYNESSERYYIHGPGMQYSKSYTNDRGLIRGRIYMGLLSTFSFIKPDQNDPEAHEKYKDKERQMENFYKSCCRYIRKNFRRDDVGFYHGAESDDMARNGIEKFQFNLR